ncbi:recombinase family protein [Microbacterium sp. AZCO]|uniref:recombinase family protein n=1 Tax=Microbacterium sp. AZCO TaxID=3142976 RepID=UPI0031F39EF4
MSNSEPIAPLPRRLRVCIYARISSDKKGAGLGVERQIADCRELAERLGWEVVAVFVDNDISAASGKPRPGYRDMLTAVRGGRVDAIIAWHTDRLHRRPTELEEFITLVEATGVKIQTVKAGELDLSTPSGRMVARMLGSAARYEVDQTRDRIRRAKQEAAKKGEYRGGKRPFGYEPGGMVVRESEAAMVREATKAIIAGRSLRGIAVEWNEQGRLARREQIVKDEHGQVVRDAEGNRQVEIVRKEWSALTVREMVLRPRNAGILAHGVPGRKTTLSGAHRYEFEEIGPAAWPALVSEDEWRAVVKVLTNPARRDFEGTRERKHLGSSLYYCGGLTGEVDAQGEPIECGTLMRSGTHGGGVRHYRCRLGGKGHVMTLAAPADKFVRETVAAYLSDPRMIAALTPAAPDVSADRERRAALVARLATFEADYALGVIDGRQLQSATNAVEAEIAAIDAKIAKAVRSATSSEVMSAADPAAAFLAATLDVQRATVAGTVRVTVVPNYRRGAAWSSDRLRIEPATA